MIISAGAEKAFDTSIYVKYITHLCKAIYAKIFQQTSKRRVLPQPVMDVKK